MNAAPPAATELQRAGVEGNARLTGLTGMLLLVLLAVEGATILRIRELITVHVYLGVLLLGPALLKTASTVYRFARYYTGAPPYRQKGAPHPLLRILGPLVVLTTFTVLGTGIGLLAVPRDHAGLLLTAHKASFIIWFAVMTVHVLSHLHEAVTTSARDMRAGRRDPATRRRRLRIAALALALAIGLGTATALLPAASGWTSGAINHIHR